MQPKTPVDAYAEALGDTEGGVLSAPSPTQNNIAEKMILKTEPVEQSSRCDDTDLSTVAIIIFSQAKEGDLQMMIIIDPCWTPNR